MDEESKERWYPNRHTIDGITIITYSPTPIPRKNHRLAGQALGSLFGALGSGGHPLTTEEYELRRRLKKGGEGNW